MNNVLSKSLPWVAPVAVFLFMLFLWDFAVQWFEINKVILPRPRDVIAAFGNERWVLAQGAKVTFQAAAAGLLCSALFGSFFAVVFSQSSIVRTSLYPYVLFLQTVPIVAIAPLLILWFGNEFKTIVLVSCIISIFPVISNVTSGLLSIQSSLLDVFRMQNASRWQILTKLRIPAAIPQLILGLRVSCGLAVIGAIVGEFFVGTQGAYDGLGTIITARQGNLKTASMIAAVMTCTGIGLFLLTAVNLLGWTVLKRWTRDVGFEGNTRGD